MIESDFWTKFITEYGSDEGVINQKSRIPSDTRNRRATDAEIYVPSGPTLIKYDAVEERPVINFCTGSTYKGEWNQFGIGGEGLYTFPNGIHYQGKFREGQFHGKGKLIYPNGSRIQAIWENGQAHHAKLVFGDGLEYKSSNWKYCQFPDRRYFPCIKNNISPIGESYITSTRKERKIPDGCYDTIDGIFNPKLSVVYNPDSRSVIRIPTKRESEWIINNCRRGTFSKMPQHRKPVRMESKQSLKESQ